MSLRSALVCLLLAVVVETACAAEDCSATVVAKWLRDGRKMQLTEDYRYKDPNGVLWNAPSSTVVDGASIPQFLWFGGGPFEGLYRDASVVHDVACVRKDRSWEQVHRMFYDHMLCSGVDEVRAAVMYWAVYQCGPRWRNIGIRIFPCGDNDLMKTYTAQMTSYIQRSDPSVECATCLRLPPTQDEQDLFVIRMLDVRPQELKRYGPHY